MLRYALLFVIAVWAATLIPREQGATKPEVERTPEQGASSLGVRPPTAPIPTPEPGGKPSADVPEPFATVAEMHRSYTEEFVMQSGFGLARMASIGDPIGSRVQVGGSPYYLKTHRLIGAWLHRKPRLYETQAFDVGHDVKSVPWTGLDEIDARAMKTFKDGADIFVSNDHSRALGALRATNACVKCHDAALGTVLGALRYDLVTSPPTGATAIDPVPAEYTPK